MRIAKTGSFDLKQFLEQRNSVSVEVEEKVKWIIAEVKAKGDIAVLDFTKQFDKVELPKGKLLVSENEIETAWKNADKKLVKALNEAKKNIEFFCRKQLEKEWISKNSNGFVGEIVRPVEKVGVYVPAGKYPLVSSVLMNVLPAKIAGVKEIIMATPPGKGGKVNESILVAAKLAGVSKIFKIGGAQAIAAMAYGTESVPSVNKIVGPGNVFVSTAKKLVFGKVGIDFFAGPSEALILAEKGNAKFIAADLLAQAEHDENSQAILIATSQKLAEEVEKEVELQLNDLSTAETAGKSLQNFGLILIAKNLDDAIGLANEIAPEHLQIYSNDLKILKKIKNAGSIFLGELAAIPLGDYASGTNHVLPTNGFAKVRGGLSARDFQKIFAVQGFNAKGFEKLGKTAAEIAEKEGLKGHKNAVEIRAKEKKD